MNDHISFECEHGIVEIPLTAEQAEQLKQRIVVYGMLFIDGQCAWLGHRNEDC